MMAKNGPDIYRDTYDLLLFSVAQIIFWLSTERLSRNPSHLKEGGEESLYSCTCNCDFLHRRLGADSGKIPEGGTSNYILHLSCTDQDLDPQWNIGQFPQLKPL